MTQTSTERSIGGVRVGAVGLGEMALSVDGRPSEAQAMATVHAALDAGVRLIDTADAYSLTADDFGHGEELVARALASYGGDTSDVLVATKGGHFRTPEGAWGVNGDPAYLRSACEQSLRRLGVDAIGLYQFHRPDPTVPYADSVGALADLLDAGTIRLAGISNADPAQIRTAQEVLGGRLASVQNQYSPRFRTSRPELDLCDELGIAFLPWSPLGGIGRADRTAERYAAFAEVAAEVGASPQQVTLAWMIAASPLVVPIPGSRRPETIRDSYAAGALVLTDGQLARLDAVERVAD
jgi:aryl-alcohol dehydrogenase-like predicted oxidoreductase